METVEEDTYTTKEGHIVTGLAARQIKSLLAGKVISTNGKEKPRAKHPLTLPHCIYEGEVIQRCASCRADSPAAQLRHRRKCNHPTATHESKGNKSTCTRTYVDSDITACDTCEFRQESDKEPIKISYTPIKEEEKIAPPTNKRHLLYHILPVKDNGVWRRNVDALRLRWGLFSGGRKIVSVATGPPFVANKKMFQLDEIAVVKDYFPSDCEFIEVENSSSLREVASWNFLWEEINRSADDNDAVFWSHAKGTTRPTAIQSVEFGSTATKWADILYHLSLDFWYLIEEEFLRGKEIVGALPKLFPFVEEPIKDSLWHYSGGMYWLRIFSSRERTKRYPIPQHGWATEAWPGIAFKQEEIGTVGPTHKMLNDFFDPYKPSFWDNLADPVINEWKAAHKPQTDWSVK